MLLPHLTPFLLIYFPCSDCPSQFKIDTQAGAPELHHRIFLAHCGTVCSNSGCEPGKQAEALLPVKPMCPILRQFRRNLNMKYEHAALLSMTKTPSMRLLVNSSTCSTFCAMSILVLNFQIFSWIRTVHMVHVVHVVHVVHGLHARVQDPGSASRTSMDIKAHQRDQSAT